MIRALIAEDSPTTAELLRKMLESDPEIRVVGLATDGEKAVALARELRPSVVVMDVQMPHLNGFEATRRIMAEAPTPIIIVSSTVNVHETAVSMRALELGALALLEKPVGPLHPDFEEACRRFVGTVRALSEVKVVRRWASGENQIPRASSRPGAPAAEIVAMAASTGGPAALYRVLASVGPDFQAPVLIVQHMAPGFIEGFAEWLQTGTRLSVSVAEHGRELKPGHVYIAPDDHQLGLIDAKCLAVSNAPPIDGFRPSGTFLFDAVAKTYGNKALGVILTGMGRDGVDGLRKIRSAGGRVVAQDEATSIVFGMPGATVGEGLAHDIVPLDAIGPRLGAWAAPRRRSSRP